MPVKMEHRTLEDKILLAITASATLILFPFLITSILAKDTANFLVDLVAVGGIFLIFLGVWLTSKIKLFSGLFAVLSQVTILVGIHLKGEALIFWLFPIIIAGFYLLPTILACAFNFLLISIGCFLTYQLFDDFTFPRLVAAFIVTNLFSLIFSVFMQNKNRQLSEQDKINQLHNKILELIASSNKLSKILPTIVEGIESEIPNVTCSALLLDKTGKHLIVGAGPSLPAFYNDAINGLGLGEGGGAAGEAAFTGKREIVNDIAKHPNSTFWAALAKKAKLASCWSEPIIGNQGGILGTFFLYYQTISTPKAAEFKVIEQFVNLARIAIEREKADATIWQQANYDSLTSLPNRNLLHEHLDQAIAGIHRDNKQLAIAMLDLDKFKEVNDTLGHAAGDIVLVECSKRIKACIRQNDIAARLGGDEFIIVFVGTTLHADIESIGKKLSDSLAKPYVIQQQNVFCTASIGIAFYPPTEISTDTLLKNADKAMYRAKKQGRNSVYFYNEAM